MSSALDFDQLESPRSFLNEVYRSLDYEKGVLLDAVAGPNDETNQEWLEKGDWLVLAKKAGAEKVFFVNNDPVLVFCEFQQIPDDQSLLARFRRVWCMARPQSLFIASPGELRVYRLDQPPTMNIEILREDRQIATVKRVAEVVEKLQAYHRERVELGHLAIDWRFGGIDQRADRRLIQDLKNLRQLLLNKGLDPRYVHALIGRSIFVRYLEDREVLTSKYFEEVADGNPEWMHYLSEDLEKPDLQTSVANRWYIRVLNSKEFTYALFNRLAFDFNDDMSKVRKWPKPGRGFEKDFPTGSHNPSGWLQNYKTLPTECFTRYGEINFSDLEPVPDKVHRYGDPHLQSGWRLLIKRGIDQANDSYGRIEARLENRSYCFQNSIHGLNVSDAEDWERKILIGIIWSSLARYYYFMTASSWGTWHYEIHLEEAVSLPIQFPKDEKLRREIIEVVDTLLGWNIEDCTNNNILQTILKLEQRLDRAIFDLYKLNNAQGDLILDMCEVNLEFFYKHNKSNAIQSVERFPQQSQGCMIDVPGDKRWERGLEGYIHAFLEVWNPEMEPEGEFRWRVVCSSLSPMIAVIFSTQEKGDTLPARNFTDEDDWVNILEECSQILGQPVSRRIYIDGMIRVVSDTDIYIIKRDERRLWTRSMAREDAEATLLQAMNLQEAARM